nr:TlpA disulfide reductase family protein [Flavihumibacter rivuli]
MWKAQLLREDGHHIVFNFDLRYEKKQPFIRVHNAEERLEVRSVKTSGDSVFIDMPFFESSFKLARQADGSLKGIWVKGTTGADVVMPFEARPGNESRFSQKGIDGAGLNGRWEMSFIRKNGTSRPAIAELSSKGTQLTGSILTPTGDYRYLDGVTTGDSIFLSTFDGSHAYRFEAAWKGDRIEGGVFYSGPVFTESFSAVRNDTANLSMDAVSIFLKPGQDRLDFRFPDLDGKMVGINDGRFRNKVVVVQLMGSWCPNCMDETNYLSDYYKKNKKRGVEMVSLAYEYSTDPIRSRNSLKKFQQRFDVQYPMLITGVTSSDTLRTEKTLPQLTPIKSFPSTIFIGKDGRVKKIHGGFFGPGTGEHYTKYKQEFEETINTLLEEE